MADISFDGDKAKAEDAYVLAYGEFVFVDDASKLTIKRIPEEKVVRPDYFVVEKRELLEVKEIHDRAQTQQWAAWGRRITSISEAVTSLGEASDVNGTYLVNAPEVFRLNKKRKHLSEGAKTIVEAIKAGQPYVDVFDTRFTISKVSDHENLISFGNISTGRSIDPAATVAGSMKTGIDKANRQLGNPPTDIEVVSRKLLFINKYIFTLHNWELFSAVSKVFSDLRLATDIDEVWVQFRDNNNNFFHKRVYDRQLFDRFEAGEFGGWSLQDCELFSDWFGQLYELGEDNKQKIFEALKALLEDKKPYELFPSAINRTEMIKLGLWLCENKRYDDACWLIDQFIDDPVGLYPPDNRDIAAELADEIMTDKDIVQITTTLGWLAWVVTQLSLSEKHIADVARYTIALAGKSNLYIKSQALHALNQLMPRQEWLKAYDKANGTHCFDELKQLAFTLMRDYGQYTTIASLLANTFDYLRDVDVDESIEILQRLKKGESISRLYVFYALFRSEQSREFGEYDDAHALQQLESVINSDDAIDERLLSNITWQFWKYLKENPDGFDKLSSLISRISNRPYKKSNYSLEHIIEEWVDRKPNKAIKWFINLIDQMTVVADGSKGISDEIWLTSTEKVLTVIAAVKPELLAETIDKLIALCDKGAIVGNLSVILTSYNGVSDSRLKDTIKKSSMAHFEHMQKMQPMLEDVSFS